MICVTSSWYLGPKRSSSSTVLLGAPLACVKRYLMAQALPQAPQALSMIWSSFLLLLGLFLEGAKTFPRLGEAVLTILLDLPAPTARRFVPAGALLSMLPSVMEAMSAEPAAHAHMQIQVERQTWSRKRPSAPMPGEYATRTACERSERGEDHQAQGAAE